MKVSIQIYIVLACLCLSLALYLHNQTKQTSPLSILNQSFEIDFSNVHFMNGISTEKVYFNQDFASKFPEEASAAALLFNLNEPHFLTYQVMKTVVIPASFSTPQFSHLVLILKSIDLSASWLYISAYDENSQFGYYVFKLGRIASNSDVSISFHLDKTVTISYQDETHRVITRNILIPANGMITQE